MKVVPADRKESQNTRTCGKKYLSISKAVFEYNAKPISSLLYLCENDFFAAVFTVHTKPSGTALVSEAILA